MTRAYWQERLDRCPAMRPWLLRAAKRAVTAHSLLPAALTLGEVPEDKTVRRALDEIFPGCREENGRLKARLDDAMRERERWLPLAGLLGIKPASSASEIPFQTRFTKTIQRLKLLHPDACALIASLHGDDVFKRFLKTSPSADEEIPALFDAALYLRSLSSGITLSELGAKFFNDSKALRGGSLRQQLEHLLRLQTDDTEIDTAALFNACGVIENPYTTHAAVFAPFAYCAQDGEWLDWPYRLWQRGEAALLAWETVRAITVLRFEAPCTELVTSENAAPFHRLVEMRRAALYTEGYPNAAVKTLLRHFAQAGVSNCHWGDTDLDGYRIAEQIARILPTRFYAPPLDEKHRRRLLRLTPEQKGRTERYLLAHPDFPYRNELCRTLEHGWLEQEQSIDLFV